MDSGKIGFRIYQYISEMNPKDSDGDTILPINVPLFVFWDLKRLQQAGKLSEFLGVDLTITDVCLREDTE